MLEPEAQPFIFVIVMMAHTARLLLNVVILTAFGNNVSSLLSCRCGLRHDGRVHLYRHLLQCGYLHRLLLLFHIHDQLIAMDVLQQPLEYAGLQRRGAPKQRQHR